MAFTSWTMKPMTFTGSRYIRHVIPWLQLCWSLSLALSSQQLSPSASHFVLLGGFGKIGTSVAKHLLERDPSSRVTLVGRGQRRRGGDTGKEISHLVEQYPHRVMLDLFDDSFDVWNPATLETEQRLQRLIDSCDCLIHTAGPYYPDQPPTILTRVLDSPTCRVYVDVSDPVEFLQASQKHHERAVGRNKTCLLAAGAFPGMSNVLAMEAAGYMAKQDTGKSDSSAGEGVHNLYFQYFTSGLGGSGTVNLYITNLGFGEPMRQFYKGSLRACLSLS